MACAELMVTLALDRRFWVARKDSDGVKVPKDTWRFRKDGAAGEQRPAAAQAARYFSELRYARVLPKTLFAPSWPPIARSPLVCGNHPRSRRCRTSGTLAHTSLG